MYSTVQYGHIFGAWNWKLAADQTSWQCREVQVAKDASSDVWARGSGKGGLPFPLEPSTISYFSTMTSTEPYFFESRNYSTWTIAFEPINT